jgi:hypothetical protein
MEDALLRLKSRLSESKDSYGFFFYAGHGVQSQGDNFLIPVNSNIPTESNLRTRAVSVQTVLDDLNDAKNSLNVVVLDACRDNPFGWSRSGTRGLTIVTRQPADSIIVYATSAGQRASDGEGRNGLFTSQLLANLATPGLEVSEVFKRTGADVAHVSNNQQIPAIYSQFFKTAYLGVLPSDAALASVYVPGSSVRPAPQPLPGADPGKDRRPGAEKRLWSIGASAGTSFAEPWLVGTVRGTVAPFNNIFLELGVDIGALSGVSKVGYYSFFPYASVAYFRPLTEKISVYAGAGAGYLFATYKFPEVSDPHDVRTFAASVTAGGTFFTCWMFRILCGLTLKI